MNSLIKKLRKLNTIFYINNFYPNYINKWLFRFAFFCIILSFLHIAYLNDFDFSTHAYIKCNSNFKCSNPFYACLNQSHVFMDFTLINCKPYNKINCADGVCLNKSIDPNSYLGVEPFNFHVQFLTEIFFIIIIAFAINHLNYVLRCNK